MSDTTPEETDSAVSDVVVSYIRTYVPILWGTLMAFLVGKGIDVPALSDPLLVTGILIPACIAGWYALGRLAERKLPRLGKLMLGSRKQPSYAPQNADGSYTITELTVPVEPDLDPDALGSPDDEALELG